jgi:hypothetical protein
MNSDWFDELLIAVTQEQASKGSVLPNAEILCKKRLPSRNPTVG